MNKFIRWQGLVGFLVFIALVVGFWLVAAPYSIQYAIENYGSDMNGAKVEVSDVGLSFNPLGLTITGLQVADAEQPMLNTLQAKNMQAQIALAPLFQGKVIVQSMQVTGLNFDTPRTTSGAVAIPKTTNKEEPKTQEENKTSVTQDFQQALPSASDLLARQPLTTVIAGEALKGALQQSDTNINQAIKAVPNKAALAQYKQQITALQQSSPKTLAEFKAIQQQLANLKKQWNADKQSINQAKQVIQTSTNDLKEKYNAAKNGPDSDFNNLMSKYQLNGQGAANISQLLFGDEIGDWVKLALYWQKKAEPYMQRIEKQKEMEKEQAPERLEGRFVSFPTVNPQPDFLIKEAVLSMQLEHGELNIELADITTQQHITKKPTSLTINSNALKGIQSLFVAGTFDLRTSPAQHQVRMKMDNVAVTNYKLGGDALQLQTAQANVTGDIIVDGLGMRIQGKSLFSDALFVSHAESKYGRMVGKTLADIHKFKISSSIKGDLKKPQVSIQSDLDKKFKAAALAQFQRKKAELEQQVKAELKDKLTAYAAPYQQKINDLQAKRTELEQARAKIDDLLNAELAAFKDEQKAKAQQKAQDAKNKAIEKAKERLKNFKF